MNRTEVKIDPVNGWLDKSHSILSIGSCFSENVGDLLLKDSYKIEVNPTGILFNPHSIAKAFRNAIDSKVEEQHFGDYLDTHFHFDYHSRMNGSSREEVMENLKEKLSIIKDQLASVDRLIITFGTAWVYQLNRTEKIVANCHKVPQKEFTKMLIGFPDMYLEWSKLLVDLKHQNPKLEVLLTVSPIRHTRKGIHENNVSKGILLQLCYELDMIFPYVKYFPSYEIMLDELRDYKYFKEDLIHPTDEAIDYIYQKFVGTYC